ncbi:MAG: hypothetical protein KDA84_01540, partial [Planctomycetaceae bacterium]|nr:hypothetical protein [Planctomycetaceae bacterium]
LKGFVVLVTEVDADATAHIVAGARDNSRMATTELADQTTQNIVDDSPALALFVEAAGSPNLNYFHSNPPADGWANAFADTSLRGLTYHADILWDADVTILGGRGGTPELVVDETGKIIKKQNVIVTVVNDANETVELDEGATILQDEYFVSVTNNGHADVLFRADAPIPSLLEVGSNSIVTTSDSITNQTLPEGPIFTFSDNLSDVKIIDYSPADLHLEEIDLIYTPDGMNTPLVQLLTTTIPVVDTIDASFEFAIVRGSSGDGLVDIQKLNSTADIYVDGSVNNPTGRTRLINAQLLGNEAIPSGDILSGGGTITTNQLDIEATGGDIGGSDANRIDVELVRSANLANGQIRDVELVAISGRQADDNIYFRLQGLDRVPGGINPLPIHIHTIAAGGTIELILDDSKHQTGTGTAGAVRVFATETELTDGIGIKFYDMRHFTHFLDDTALDPGLDPAAHATTDDATISSVYTFAATHDLQPRTVGNYTVINDQTNVPYQVINATPRLSNPLTVWAEGLIA